MILCKKKIVFRPVMILEYLWALLVVLNGNSVYHASMERDYKFPYLCTFLSIFLLLTVREKNRENRSRFGYSLFLFAYFFVYFLVKYGVMSKDVYVLCYMISIPCLFLYFTALNGNNDTSIPFYRLESIVIFLAIISLIVWSLGAVFGMFKPNCDIMISWGKARCVEGFWGIHYIIQYDNTFMTGLPRNSSIFCEAPMFNLWLCIALSTELFLKKESKKWKVFLLLFTILTTISLTGVLFVFLAFLLLSFANSDSALTTKRIVWGCGIIIAVPFLALIVQELMVYKASTASYSTRMQDYIAGWRLWKENPIWGSGFGNIVPLQKYVYKADASIMGFSNSITALLATGGVWNFIIYLIAIVAPMIGKFENQRKIQAFTVCYCFLTVTALFFARYIAVIFIAFGLAYLPKFRVDKEINRD